MPSASSTRLDQCQYQYRHRNEYRNQYQYQYRNKYRNQHLDAGAGGAG